MNSDKRATGPLTTVNLDTDGIQHGFLRVRGSADQHAMSLVQIPICVLRRGDGPVTTIVGGVHGDEFEGPLTILRLARELQIDQINGCLILIPCLNPAALQRQTRFSTFDQQDMDQVFPGNDNGSVTEKLAALFASEIVTRSDVLVDLRSGGRSLEFLPLVSVTSSGKQISKPDDQERWAEECMIAFGAPNSLRMPSWNQQGSLGEYAKSQGCSYVMTELGGGGTVRKRLLDIAYTGCRNLLSHQGLITDDITLCATRMLEVQKEDCYHFATATGLLEMHVRLDQEVYTGDMIAQLVNPYRSGDDPVPVRAARNGIVMAVHHGGLVNPGDCLAILADEVQR